MRSKRICLIIAVFVGIGVAGLMTYAARHAPKARAQRVQSVNNVRTVTFTLPPTNATPMSSPRG